MAIFKVSKYLYALSLDETLSKLEEQGADLATINFIKNSDQTIKPLYVKYLKENLNANISELQNNVQPIKKTENPLSPKEQAVINSLDDFMKVWATSRLRQIKFLKPGGETGYRYFEDYQSDQALAEIKNKFEQIADMVQYAGGEYSRFDLSTYNFNQALELSDEWHEQMVEDGAGRFYTPISRNSKGEIVDSRVLKVFENGWYIIEVDSENDLKVEGNKMNHCVGGYWRDVKSGRSKILSLRNQFNQPQATAEITDEGIEQIQGNSNNLPNNTAVKLFSEYMRANHYSWAQKDDDIPPDVHWSRYGSDGNQILTNIESAFYVQSEPEFDAIFNIPHSKYESDKYYYDYRVLTTDIFENYKESDEHLNEVASKLITEYYHEDHETFKNYLPSNDMKLSIPLKKQNLLLYDLWWECNSRLEEFKQEFEDMKYYQEKNLGKEKTNEELLELILHGEVKPLSYGVMPYAFIAEIFEELSNFFNNTEGGKQYKELYKKTTRKNFPTILPSEKWLDINHESYMQPKLIDEDYSTASAKYLLKLAEDLDKKGNYKQASELEKLAIKLAKYNAPRAGKKKKRWSVKYKKNIDCNSPKGFSQKQYCKRKKRGGEYKS